VKPRTVLVLAVVVIALGAFIWFVDRDLPSSDQRAELAGKLLSVKPDEVTGLTAEWQGRSVRFERRGKEAGAAAGWWLVEPMSARADSSEVDRLVDALTGLEKKRTLEDADLQAVGLDSPRGTITLRAGDRQWTLGVGADVPTSSDVLVSLAAGDGSAGTYVTTAGFVDQLGRDPGDWRVQGAVERLTLHTPGETAPVVLERRGERFWLEQPVADLADADQVDDLLAGLTSLRVTKFVDDVSPDGTDGADETEGTDLGLSSPRLSIEALVGEAAPEEGGAEQEPFRLELGAPVGEPAPAAEADATDGKAPKATLYARASGQTFTTTTDLLALGTVPAGQWRSPAWTGLRSFDIDGVDVEAPDGSFTLKRDGIDWQRDGETLPYGVVNGLLSAVTEAKGEVVVGGPAEGDLSPEPVTLHLTRKDGDPVTLTLQGEPSAAGEGDETGAARLARTSERTVAVRLSGETVQGILDALAAVRDAEPEAPAAEVAEGASGDAAPE